MITKHVWKWFTEKMFFLFFFFALVRNRIPRQSASGMMSVPCFAVPERIRTPSACCEHSGFLSVPVFNQFPAPEPAMDAFLSCIREFLYSHAAHSFNSFTSFNSKVDKSYLAQSNLPKKAQA